MEDYTPKKDIKSPPPAGDGGRSLQDMYIKIFDECESLKLLRSNDAELKVSIMDIQLHALDSVLKIKGVK